MSISPPINCSSGHDREIAHVSRATVYRTLPLLTESNLVHEMDFGKPYKFYDPNYSDHPNHNHLICEDCEKIVEFDSEQIDSIENEIGQKLGFTVKSQKLQLSATCDKLKRAAFATTKPATRQRSIRLQPQIVIHPAPLVMLKRRQPGERRRLGLGKNGSGVFLQLHPARPVQFR